MSVMGFKKSGQSAERVGVNSIQVFVCALFECLNIANPLRAVIIICRGLPTARRGDDHHAAGARRQRDGRRHG